MAKVRRNYSSCPRMLEACRLYREGTVSNLSALSKKFGVDRKSLRQRVKNDIRVEAHQGHKTYLSTETEREISGCLQVLCQWGWGFTKSDLLDLVEEYVKTKDMETPFTNGRPGRKWFERFMRDHPELTVRKSEQFPEARAKASADSSVHAHWFNQVLGKAMDDTKLHDKPQNIYNVDETGFMTDPSSEKVLAPKGLKNVYQNTGGSGREQITVCITGNAAGQSLPPYVVYKGKNLYSTWCKDGPESARYAVSDHGWMERALFEDYFQNLFLKESSKWSDMSSPRILIFDGHASHISLRIAQMAKENNVVLLRLPSHLTHILQPLDKAVFGEVKRQWRKKLRCHSRVSRDKIRKEDFPSKLSDVLETAMKSENLKSGFGSTGIYPLNPDRVSSEVTESYTPYTEVAAGNADSLEDLTIQLPLLKAMPVRSTPDTLVVSPPAQSCSLPLQTSANEESMSQIILSVETIPGSNFLNITNIEVASHPHEQMSAPQPSTSAQSSSSAIDKDTIKDFFLKRITPRNKENIKKQRITTLKYGESLTSAQAMARLAENKKKRMARNKKKEVKKGKTTTQKKGDAPKPVEPTEDGSNEDAKSHGDPPFTIKKDVYYAVMFTSPAAYYIGRSINESTPPEGERYVMKFLNRGPDNTYFMPPRDKIEDVERRFILCKAELEGAGPFRLKNHHEIESHYRNMLKAMK